MSQDPAPAAALARRLLEPIRVRLDQGVGHARWPVSESVDLDDVEGQLRERPDAIRPAPRAELLHVLMLPDFDRAGQIQLFYGNSKTRTFAELMIDLEESPHARGVVLGILRERELRGGGS